MKNVLFLLLLVANFSKSSAAYSLPGDSTTVNGLRTIAIAKPAEQANKRLSFFQKIKTKVSQNKLVRHFVSDRGEPTEKQKKLGKLSMIFGIASFALIFVPYVGILSIPAAITALVLGLKSIKGNSNTQGLIGVITGSAVLFIIAIAVIAIMSSGYWF